MKLEGGPFEKFAIKFGGANLHCKGRIYKSWVRRVLQRERESQQKEKKSRADIIVYVLFVGVCEAVRWGHKEKAISIQQSWPCAI